MKDETTSNYVYHKNYGIGVIIAQKLDPVKVTWYHISFGDGDKLWCTHNDFELLPVEEFDER